MHGRTSKRGEHIHTRTKNTTICLGSKGWVHCCREWEKRLSGGQCHSPLNVIWSPGYPTKPKSRCSPVSLTVKSRNMSSTSYAEASLRLSRTRGQRTTICETSRFTIECIHWQIALWLGILITKILLRRHINICTKLMYNVQIARHRIPGSWIGTFHSLWLVYTFVNNKSRYCN